MPRGRASPQRDPRDPRDPREPRDSRAHRSSLASPEHRVPPPPHSRRTDAHNASPLSAALHDANAAATLSAVAARTSPQSPQSPQSTRAAAALYRSSAMPMCVALSTSHSPPLPTPPPHAQTPPQPPPQPPTPPPLSAPLPTQSGVPSPLEREPALSIAAAASEAQPVRASRAPEGTAVTRAGGCHIG
eukprot:5248762-Pleurochrysis_carterae.AAC.5